MARQKALFFLRNYNDIDHIVPVIYKWLSLETIPIDVVITSNPVFLKDFRIQFLQQFGTFQVRFIDDFLTESERARKKASQMANILAKLDRLGLVGRMTRRLPAPPAYDTAFIDGMLDTVFQETDRGIVVFDWVFHDLTQRIIESARARGYASISLPHGDMPHRNLMVSTTFLNYEQALAGHNRAGMFDYIVVPNQLCARRPGAFLPPNRVKILGSPRYNDEWLSIFSTLVPDFDPGPSCAAGDLRMVMFLRNINYPIFWEEVSRTLDLILQFPRVFLVVKGHTRLAKVTHRMLREEYEMGTHGNPKLHFVTDDIHSGSLLKWADLVLDLGTSVTFESVKDRKPVLALDYLHAYRSTIAEYMRNCDIQCRDDLYDWIATFSEDKATPFYDEAERQRFIAEMIDVPDRSVLGRYVGFLKSCIESGPVLDEMNQPAVSKQAQPR